MRPFIKGCGREWKVAYKEVEWFLIGKRYSAQTPKMVSGWKDDNLGT